jgi:hypothetical protein
MAWNFGNTALGDMFGFNSDAEDQAADTAAAAQEMAEQYWDATAGIRDPLIDRLAAFMDGNLDVSQSPLYDASKAAMENQYKVAQENLLANLPGGGGLSDAMVGLEASRAMGLTDLIGRLMQDEYNKAYGLASGSPQQTFQGLQTAGQNLAPVIGSQAQTQSAQWGALGSAMGG